MQEEIFGIMIAGVAVVSILVILPWIILHYVSKWKTAATLTTEDENLLEELHELARRLDERMCTIERIVQAENPNWRSLGCDPVEAALEDRQTRRLETAERSGAPLRRNR